MAIRVDAFYGQSGTGKSEAIAAIIEHIFATSGKTARVRVGDGSMATYVDRGLVDAGVVEILDFSMREWPLTTFKLLSEGYWPADVNDPKSPLLPPTADYVSKIGVDVFEGLSVGAQYLMGNVKGGLSEAASRGIKIGQDSPIRFKDVLYDAQGKEIPKSGPGTEFGGNPVAHFGVAQRHLLSNVERSKGLPGWVIWTAHERSTEDKISKEKLVGPEAAGEAMTANLPRVFNNTLHFTTAARKKDKKKDEHTEALVTELDTEYRLYTRDHFHPDGNTFVKYKAVVRGVSAHDGLKEYYTSDIPGQAALDLYQFIADKKRARAAAIKAAQAAA